MDRILNMILRQVVRRLTTRGSDRPAGRAKPGNAPDGGRTTREAMRVLRRVSRF
ncbi:hypothetical protein HKCCE3408_18185 [Rhodobacterales bacterium HKCCE3408]|nr:hypothetical protein [Rhodobacterales bacterium HKCCE3408]